MTVPCPRQEVPQARQYVGFNVGCLCGVGPRDGVEVGRAKLECDGPACHLPLAGPPADSLCEHAQLLVYSLAIPDVRVEGALVGNAARYALVGIVVLAERGAFPLGACAEALTQRTTWRARPPKRARCGP